MAAIRAPDSFPRDIARYDEVRFWNRPMNDEEIKRTMSLAVSPLEKLPLTWGGIKTRHIE